MSVYRYGYRYIIVRIVPAKVQPTCFCWQHKSKQKEANQFHKINTVAPPPRMDLKLRLVKTFFSFLICLLEGA